MIGKKTNTAANGIGNNAREEVDAILAKLNNDVTTFVEDNGKRKFKLANEAYDLINNNCYLLNYVSSDQYKDEQVKKRHAQYRK